MCCLALTAGFIGPRVALVLWWIFGDRVDLAFDTWIWPLLGIIFLPWTTLAYVLDVVGGRRRLGLGVDHLVALGFALDVATYSARSAQSRYQASSAY